MNLLFIMRIWNLEIINSNTFSTIIPQVSWEYSKWYEHRWNIIEIYIFFESNLLPFFLSGSLNIIFLIIFCIVLPYFSPDFPLFFNDLPILFHTLSKWMTTDNWWQYLNYFNIAGKLKAAGSFAVVPVAQRKLINSFWRTLKHFQEACPLYLCFYDGTGINNFLERNLLEFGGQGFWRLIFWIKLNDNKAIPDCMNSNLRNFE